MYGKNARTFVNDTSGAVLLYVAFMSSAVLGIAGLAIDTGHWYATQRAAQGAADAAAIAAARELKWSDDIADLTAAANELALKNGFEAAAVTVNHPPASGPNAGNAEAVEVIIQQATPGFFSTLFLGDGGVEVSARSVSGAAGGSPVCFLALDPSVDKAINLSSSSAIQADGCMVQVNSSDAEAILTSGSATVTAETVSVVGDVSNPSAITPEPETGVPAMADPLAYLTPPTYDPGNCMPENTFDTDQTIDPGVYCGGLTISGSSNITFNPGLYVIKDGKFRVSGGHVQGEGVTFYLTGSNAFVSYSGGPTVHFSAPTTGEMAGLLFYQGPDAPHDKTSKFTGGSGEAWYEGALYFPDQDLEMTGGSSATVPPHTTIVARAITISGGGTFTLGSDYATSAVPAMPGFGGGSVAILE